jgi:hypothetical protein
MRLPIALALVAALSSHAWAADSDGTLPDPALTPGAVATQDVGVICHRGKHKGETTATYRHTTTAEKNAVYRAYGLANHHAGWCSGPHGCAVDHVEPLECGGADVKENLFPQKGDGPYNQEDKNRLEGLCHKLVCSGKITPAEGQSWFMPDWRVEYDRRFGAIPGEK